MLKTKKIFTEFEQLKKSKEYLNSINKTSNKKLILDNLIDLLGKLIAENKLKLGDILPGERVIAKSLKISRSSVREALKILGFMGVLEIKHGTYTRLSSDMSKFLINPIRYMNFLNNVNLIDIFNDRKIIDVELVKLAAKNATNKDIKKMEEALAEAKKNIDNPYIYMYRETEFHDIISQASGNKLLTAVMASINNLLIDIREKSVNLFDDFKIPLNYHMKILEAIKARDADKAGKMMLDHINDAIKRMKKNSHFKEQLNKNIFNFNL